MKFKIGQEVTILPSATRLAVWSCEVGKVGKIVSIYSPSDICVHMLKSPTGNRGFNIEHGIHWTVTERDIEPYRKIGKQLMFDFMEK